ncbi:MAG: diadenylate cyclase CdaA [Firmicutes bacterium]|nr:diadenylate cyclase CdaA [Bacillota bacterium]
MTDSLGAVLSNFYTANILSYINALYKNPYKLIILAIDLAIVIFLIVKLVQVLRTTRAWQLAKGIGLLIIATIVSGILQLKILNFILTSFMTYGVILIIVIFQPELRRALEQLGTSKISKFFGIDKDIAAKTKENIYKIVIAAAQMAESKIGALIVIERDIKLRDIIDTGVLINSEISYQLLVNIFDPKTPLHDGAVIISENRIMAAACLLPLSDDKTISKGLGTRHRSAAGISKETDSIVVVVSEERGKISIAKDGKLIVDVKEDELKQILIKNLIIKRFEEDQKI